MAVYVLAGYGAYMAYEKFVSPKFTNLSGTEWQRTGYRNASGTQWQQEGYNNCCGV